jgi:hypothetical protein
MRQRRREQVIRSHLRMVPELLAYSWSDGAYDSPRMAPSGDSNRATV